MMLAARTPRSPPPRTSPCRQWPRSCRRPSRLALARHHRHAGVNIVGYACKVEEALALIKNTVLDAAVLDYRLENETAARVADRLSELGVPFLFQLQRSLENYPQATIVNKPTRPLVAALEKLTRGPAQAL